MAPYALPLILLATFLIQAISETYSNTHKLAFHNNQVTNTRPQGDSTVNNTREAVGGPKRKEITPQVPFQCPSQEEIERLIREDGFSMAVFNKLSQLVTGIVKAPFLTVMRAVTFVFLVLKLAAESIKQLTERNMRIS